MAGEGNAIGAYIILELEGIDFGEIDDRGAISGETTLFAPGAYISNGRLEIPKGATLQYGDMPSRGPPNNVFNKQNTDRRRDLAVTSGGMTRRVLAIRVIASDTATSSSVDNLSSNIFGTGGIDNINLKSRYEACSNGDLKMEPFEGSTSTGISIPGNSFASGVVEVTIPNTVNGASHSTIRTAATNAATALLGDLPSQFHHVMICIPPGTSGSW